MRTLSGNSSDIVMQILFVFCWSCLSVDAQELHKKGLSLLDQQSYEQIRETPSTTLGPLPASLTLERMFPLPRNQGDQGSCTAWAVSYQKAYRMYQASARIKGPEEYLQSPAYVYSALTDNQCQRGTSIKDALRFLAEHGSVDWRTLPYSGISCPDWSSAKAQAVDYSKSSASYRLSTNPSQVIQQIKEAVSDGTPVILGVNACAEFDRPEDGKITRIDNSNSNCGAHAILAVGYDDGRQAIRILNSWGPEWGDHGKAWVSYEVVTKRVAEAYVDFGPGDPGPQNPAWITDASRLDSLGRTKGTVSVPLDDLLLVQGLRANISEHGRQMMIGLKAVTVSKSSIWLNLPSDVAAQIDSVEYTFNHPSYKNPKKSIRGSSIFLSLWPGYGCVPDASLVAFLHNGKKIRAKFNYCDVLERANTGQVQVPQNSNNWDPIFSAFISQFFSDAEFAEQHTKTFVLVRTPIVYQRRGEQELVDYQAMNTAVTPHVALDMASRSKNPSLRSTASSPGYTVDNLGGRLACVHGTPTLGECADGARALEFEQDESENWWLSGVLGPVRLACFSNKLMGYQWCGGPSPLSR